MRIADKVSSGRIQSGANKTRAKMSELQSQAATMKRITKPSDDPVGMMRTQSAKTERHINEQYIKNINMAKSLIDTSEQALADVAEVLMRVKELAMGQASDASSNGLTRRTTAVEVDQLFNGLVNVGNRKFGERFLFGGFQTDDTPFSSAGEYLGDDGEVRLEVNKAVYMPVNLPGSKIFMGGELIGEAPWKKEKDEAIDVNKPVVRGPATYEDPNKLDVRGGDSGQAMMPGESADDSKKGINVFRVLKDLGVGLRTDDKAAIQNSLEKIDEAIDQVVVARAELGSRAMNLQSTMENIQKNNIDAKILESNYEDADTFELFTDIKKAQTALDATLTTSGRMIQPTLLDFLR